MIGLEILAKIISDPYRNVLVLRQIGGSNRYSTFSTLCMLINQPDITQPDLSLAREFDINKTTLTITYKPTGQMILFDGMKNPTKITSSRVPVGYLTDLYVEEAFELTSYEDFRKVDGTFRGKLPKGYFFQITLCFNAWNINHWIYEHFFKGRLEDDLNYLLTHDYQDYKDEEEVLDYGKGVYLHTSTYKINEFRDTEIYDVAMEQLRKVAPEIYKVEALGMWGNSTDATYPEFSEDLVISPSVANTMDYACYTLGIDTGLSNGEGVIKHGTDVRIRSATVMELNAVTRDYKTNVAVNEFFHSNENTLVKKTEPELISEIIDKIIEWKRLYYDHPVLMKGTILVYVDCADIGFRQGLQLEAKKKGLMNVIFMPSTKIRIQTRVDFIRLLMAWGEFKISKSCPNLIREMKNSRKGEKGEVREDFDDHSINANEYAWQPTINRIKRWGSFKQH